MQAKGCGVCGEMETAQGRTQLSIDHEHVEGWDQMTPEERRHYVRGLLCLRCNRYRVGMNTLETVLKVFRYLLRASVVRLRMKGTTK